MDNIETLESKYPWVKFYRELAHKLLVFKEDKESRKDFLTWILTIIEENKIEEDRAFRNNGKVVDDIDPFSIIVYPIIIKNKEKRFCVLENYAKRFDIKSEIPQETIGLERFGNNRYDKLTLNDGKYNITDLWGTLDLLLHKEEPEESICTDISNRMTFTYFLYLICPHKYIYYSENMPKFCKAYNLEIQKAYNWDGYKKYISIITEAIKSRAIPFENTIELSHCFKNNDVKCTNTTTMNKDVDNIIKILESNKNIILQGAPGCGKTYITTDVAVKLCDVELPTDITSKERYKKLVEDGRIGFTTFHQSMDYEEFVEGLKPEVRGEQMVFVKTPGIFKRICKKATEDMDNNYVLIIDEINRANISKVLGELITLLESSKRLGKDDEFKVTLPYSGETFGVPSNLYIIGTMNTADRSVGYIDYAIRRRFAFYTLKANEDAIIKFYEDNKEKVEDLHKKEKTLFEAVKKIVDKNLAQDFNVDDLMVGHSYFMAKNEEEFDFNLEYKIKPLLREYVRDGILIGENVKDSIEKLPTNSDTSEEK